MGAMTVGKRMVFACGNMSCYQPGTSPISLSYDSLCRGANGVDWSGLCLRHGYFVVLGFAKLDQRRCRNHYPAHRFICSALTRCRASIHVARSSHSVSVRPVTSGDGVVVTDYCGVAFRPRVRLSAGMFLPYLSQAGGG